ncbi:MAG: endo alpha-1,4 polygalactosaminidase [Ardenticatenaceae bacterium]|nr:endo alpha-1,4 polygalactosaminidase [Ardenticatenaceae bacterium]
MLFLLFPKNAQKILFAFLIAALILAGCTGDDDDDLILSSQTVDITPDAAQSEATPFLTEEETVITPQDIWRPAPGTSWQWQITGDIDTSFEVDMYDIDLFDAPQAIIDELHDDGRVVVCYFSAGSYEDWRPDAGDFPPEIVGEPLEGWPGERWLDVSNLDLLQPIMNARLDLAVSKKCDGVEPDNMTAFQNESGFELTPEDQLAYNIWLSEAAHERGLSIGLKNDLNQIEELVDYFDWALNEECFFYDECELLIPFVEQGKAVFGVEYELDPAAFCEQANALNFDYLHKNWDLDSYRTSCR